MMWVLRAIFVLVAIAAAVCVPIVLLTHRVLMPDAVELAQIDAAVQAAAPPGFVMHRLKAPDRVESDGHAKFGYFIYEASGSSSHEHYRADWRLSDGKVQLVSFKRL
jgi:hypothetical protein